MMDIWIMTLFMVIVNYAIISNSMLVLKFGVYNHLNKIYMSLLMGAVMLIGHFVLSRNWTSVIIFTTISIALLFMIRRQILIDDNQFTKSMIEHHSIAVLMATTIKNKTSNPNVLRLAREIIESQSKEIDLMKSWLIKT